jgi:hypothetical protein
MPFTESDLETYISLLVESELLVPCAAATTAAQGRQLFREGLAKCIAMGIKKYNDEVFPDALVTPVGSVSITTRVNPELL